MTVAKDVVLLALLELLELMELLELLELLEWVESLLKGVPVNLSHTFFHAVSIFVPNAAYTPLANRAFVTAPGEA